MASTTHHNATEGNAMNTTITTQLHKVGNAYATDDLRFRVKKFHGRWHLYDANRAVSNTWVNLSTIKAEALNKAETIISSKIAAESLPWDTTLDLPAAGLWHPDADGCCCSVCGRDVPSQKHGVVLVGGGALACLPKDAHLFEKYDGGAYLGVYPVGRECIKKIPAAYRYSFSDR